MSSKNPAVPFRLQSSFIPEEPIQPENQAFFVKVTGMLDGQVKDPAVVEAALSGWEQMLAKIAADQYRIGSMLLGEGEDAIAVIEDVVANLDLTACKDHAEAHHNSRLALAAESIKILHSRDSSSLGAPSGQDSGPVSCIEDDDLESAGVTFAELEAMLNGPDSHHLRNWLESLPINQRVIFVLRAIAGLSSTEVAFLLAEHGGPRSEEWTPDQVRSSFRQALCSLASQLIHATVSK